MPERYVSIRIDYDKRIIAVLTGDGGNDLFGETTQVILRALAQNGIAPLAPATSCLCGKPEDDGLCECEGQP